MLKNFVQHFGKYFGKYLQLKIISLDMVQSPAYVHPERLFRRGVLLPRLEAVGTEFLLPSVLHEAVALCRGHRCFTAAATAKVPLHHHPERKTGEISGNRPIL